MGSERDFQFTLTDRLKIGTVGETLNRLSAGEYEQWKLKLRADAAKERKAAAKK